MMKPSLRESGLPESWQTNLTPELAELSDDEMLDMLEALKEPYRLLGKCITKTHLKTIAFKAVAQASAYEAEKASALIAGHLEILDGKSLNQIVFVDLPAKDGLYDLVLVKRKGT